MNKSLNLHKILSKFNGNSQHPKSLKCFYGYVPAWFNTKFDFIRKQSFHSLLIKPVAINEIELLKKYSYIGNNVEIEIIG